MLFGNTPEKRIAREADKVASLKEDLDALSWGRVLDIGRELQSKGAEGAELGAELVSIAQSNLSLATRLGIDPAPPENRVMASGVEIVEGGLAEAALAVGETADADADTFDPQEPVEELVFRSTTELPIAVPSLAHAVEVRAVRAEVAVDDCEEAGEPLFDPEPAPEPSFDVPVAEIATLGTPSPCESFPEPEPEPEPEPQLID